MTNDPRATIEAVYRQEHGRVLAALISQLGDFELAEDALQDALVAALQSWTREGVPRNPGAWLTTAAKRRAIDRIRRDSTAARNQDNLIAEMPTVHTDDISEDEVEIPDERLKLMFTCCHPALAQEAQVALTLRTLGGLSTEEVARAFLVPVPTMAQRLARARGKIRDAGIPYRVPPAELLPERTDALLTVIYLIFNEGYVATSGDMLIRRDLCNEAIRLGTLLVNLLPPAPTSAEVRGLLALMLLHDARRTARLNATGELVLLEHQDRALWDRDQIRAGILMLDSALKWHHPGAYQIQAAISALHNQAESFNSTDWNQIAQLYARLEQITGSSVVAVNHAVAVAMAEGAEVGLHLLEKLAGMEGYYPYHAARADLLRRMNHYADAAQAYHVAADLCQNRSEQVYLHERYLEMQKQAH
jgi:RNA polymerase sigma-70 factor, ECF subfamily